MDARRARDLMTEAFARDLAEGTAELQYNAGEVTLDGGNWTLLVGTNTVVSLSLSMNETKNYDEITDTVIENVLGLEVEESFRLLDASMDGAIVRGLISSQDTWSVRLGSSFLGRRLHSGADDTDSMRTRTSSQAGEILG